MTIDNMFNAAKAGDLARDAYKVGEISKKTGLQKQPDGTWKKPEEKKTGKETERSEEFKRGAALAEPAGKQQEKGYKTWAGALSGYSKASLVSQKKQLQESLESFEEDMKDYDRRKLSSAAYKKRIDQQNFTIGGLKAINEEIKARGL